MKALTQKLVYIRWHLIAIRYLSMFKNWRGNIFAMPKSPQLESTHTLNKLGYMQGPQIGKELIDEIRTIYEPRAKDVVIRPHGAPFSNIIRAEDISADNPIMKIAFSKDVLDAAIDYFGGKVTLDSIQLLYSWPTAGDLRESQKWHKDFGDTKSFHAIIYVNDVDSIEKGPFVFINKENSRKMKKSVFIRRIQDEVMIDELQDDTQIEYFYGKSGAMVFVDPAKCYHYGSRCKTPRYAIFVTFNSTTPFVGPLELVKNNSGKLLEVAKKLRPDIEENRLKAIIG